MKSFFKTSHLFLLFFFIAAGCQRELNWELTATGSLKDTMGICMPAKVSGTFYTGITPGKDTAYIELQVNVFTTGTYIIFTDVVNGLRFADSGSFSSAGLHIIKLKPVGTPYQATVSKFTVCFDKSCCPLALDIKDTAHDLVPVNSWSYTDIGKHITYRGPINATHLLITPLSALLALRKEVTQTNDTSFEIAISFPTGNITTGVFTTDTVNAVALSVNNVCVNCAWQVAYKFYAVLTTIVVTDYDTTTKTIKGTFAGTTIDWNNDIHSIKDGVFNAVIK